MTKELMEEVMSKHNLEVVEGKGELSNEFWVGVAVTSQSGQRTIYKITYFKRNGSLEAEINMESQSGILQNKSLFVFPLLALQEIAKKSNVELVLNSSFKTKELLEAFVDLEVWEGKRKLTPNKNKMEEWLTIVNIITDHPAQQKIVQITPNLIFNTVGGQKIVIDKKQVPGGAYYLLTEHNENSYKAPIEIYSRDLNKYLNNFLTLRLSSLVQKVKLCLAIKESNREKKLININELVEFYKEVTDLFSPEEIKTLISSEKNSFLMEKGIRVLYCDYGSFVIGVMYTRNLGTINFIESKDKYQDSINLFIENDVPINVAAQNF